MLAHAEQALEDIRISLAAPDTVLVGPLGLREESARFAREARGEMVWFNVCLRMFEPQWLFDVLLRPAIQNPEVTEIQFVLDPGEQERWKQAVLPKVDALGGGARVLDPLWVPLEESVSCILAETGRSGVEALLSFWGEPFMSRTAGQQVPRYIFRVRAHSELVTRLRELERSYRLQHRQGRP